MPFDFTNTESKPDVFSLEGLIAWLEKQDPETEYHTYDAQDCLMARYYRANIPDAVRSDTVVSNWVDSQGRVRSTNFNQATLAAIVWRGDKNYGAALSRARAALDGES